MNEVVKYDSNLNRISLRGFTKSEQQTFIAICHKVKEKGTDKVFIPYEEMIKLANIDPKSREHGRELIMSSGKKLMQIVTDEVKLKGKTGFFTLFEDYWVDDETYEVEISVNKKYAWVFNDLSKNFTSFMLSDYTNFKSTYTQECFRRLKQYRSTGFWKVHIEDFRDLLGVPKSYKMSDLNKQILKPIQEELSEYYDFFEIKKIPAKSNGKRGRRPIEYLEFHFPKEKVHAYREFDYQSTYDKPQIEHTGEYIPPKKKATTSPASASKTKQATNVPGWVDRDYKNTTSDEEKARLDEYKKQKLAELNESTKVKAQPIPREELPFR